MVRRRSRPDVRLFAGVQFAAPLCRAFAGLEGAGRALLMRWAGVLAALTGLWACAASAATPIDLVAPADFDFYVLTLSWSPGFCDLGGERKSPEQCGRGAAAGFVTHGLWPDNANRDDPRACGLSPDFI